MNPKVAICYVHDDRTGSRSWESSMWAAKNFDGKHGRLIAYENAVKLSMVDGIAAARNEVVRNFLAAEPRCDWAWLVDRDMGFAEDALYRLLSVADPVQRPIVGGLTFAAWATDGDGMGGTRWDPLPVLLQWNDELDGGRGLANMQLYPISAVFPVAATGAAFLLVHRSVFEAIGEDWFTPTTDPSGRQCGEDISFCIRAGQAGFPIHVNSSVRTTHDKHIALSETDYWAQYLAPPAEQETAVIVPVLRRPQNAAPFMRSLRASTGLATVYAVADSDDPETIEAWEATGATVLIGTPPGQLLLDDDGFKSRGGPRPGTFAEKVQHGYLKTREPWIFAVGDDVEFRPGWLDHAQHVAGRFNADVVGTNDLGNPRVIAGEHATHLLIRRRYVDEIGASFDGPGIVFHMGYRHWGPDTECVELAKKRGVWAMALGSLVPHKHPLWTDTPEDEVYRLGQSYADQDMALLQRRLEVHLPEVRPVARTEPRRMDRQEFLARLHNLLQPRGYVEIGVQTGASLRLAQCPALGIDPAPRLAYPLPPTTRLAQMASDEFFALPPATQRGMGLPEHVDLAFVDGLHLHEQALRDFANVERLANERTVVVFDDVLPRSQAEAVRDPAGPDSAAKVSTGEVAFGDWTGDVWKVHPLLAAARPDLTLTLVDTTPTGVFLVSGFTPWEAGERDYAALVRWDGDDTVDADVLNRAHAVAPEVALELFAEVTA